MISRVLSVLARELREMVAPTVFFVLTLNLLVLTVAVLSDGHVVSAISHASACVGALLVGKAFLLADKVPALKRLASKPLIPAALWIAAVYYAIATALHLVERLISAATNSQGFLFRAKQDVASFDPALFLIVQLWLALLLIGYSLGSLAVRRFGRERLLSQAIPPRGDG